VKNGKAKLDKINAASENVLETWGKYEDRHHCITICLENEVYGQVYKLHHQGIKQSVLINSALKKNFKVEDGKMQK